MAASKVWAANLGTTTRRRVSDGGTYGQGQARRWYAGRYGGYDYDAFVRFALNWSGVGRIVKAVLTIYTDEGGGEIPSSSTRHPKVAIKRINGNFVEGNAADGVWEANDYTAPGGYSANARYPAYPDWSRAELGVNNIDITGIVEDWAPAAVQKRDGTAGGRAPNYGLGIFGYTDTTLATGIIGDKWPDASLRPYITLTYELGPTAPNAPTGLTPSGSIATISTFEGDFSDADDRDKLAKSTVQIYDAEHTFSTWGASGTISHANHGLVNGDQIYMTRLVGGVGGALFTKYYVVQKAASTFKVSKTLGGSPVTPSTQYSDGGWSKLLYNETQDASQQQIDASHFIHTPEPTKLGELVSNTDYRWRASLIDNEGSVGTYSALVTFSYQNVAPDAPVITPVTGSVFANPDGVPFRGTFADDDATDQLFAYEVQLSAYPEGDSHWNDNTFILWATGKRYVTLNPVQTSFETPYGGDSLAAGVYYWRARVYDNEQAASDWTYASIEFTDSFEADPESTSTAIQLRPRAPWRIVIKDMGANRGPGNVVAVIEDAKNVGASELYNSPGDLHFTLPKNHPAVPVCEPKLTHYSVQFRQGDGWHEVFAGLLDDIDASDTDIIFYGVDYLGLYARVVDERYDPSNADKPAELGGSKYVTSGKNTISYIIGNSKYGLLARAKALPNSPVGFIALGSIASMTEALTVYTTYAPTLDFISGLLDSHKAGQNRRTRIKVRQTSSGGYEVVVIEPPRTERDNLRLKFGELVQGYRVIPFGTDWATRIAGIGRTEKGIKAMYAQKTGGVSEAIWGRFTRAAVFDGVSDANDFQRRIQQAATSAAKLGKQVGLAIRTGTLQPKDGYDLCDAFPIDIVDGSIDTSALGSGYWDVVGITWTADASTGKQSTILTFHPREDDAQPDVSGILGLQPLSTQLEWQLGWTPPPAVASSRYWLDQSTGKAYERVNGTLLVEDITGTA